MKVNESETKAHLDFTEDNEENHAFVRRREKAINLKMTITMRAQVK